MKIWWCDIGKAYAAVIIAGAFIISAVLVIIFWQMPVGEISYLNVNPSITKKDIPLKPIHFIAHIRTPNPLKAVYITACTASSKRNRDKVLSIIENTEINALVVDIKDYSGTLAYASTSINSKDLSVVALESYSASGQNNSGLGCRIYDLPQFIGELHNRGIYAIARITVFQDPIYANLNPAVAVRNKDNMNTVWKDAKGLSYIDPGAPSYWDYVVRIGKEAYGIGFDELNFDYIRFPSDGDLSNIYYPWSEGKAKDEVLRNFFLYLREEFSSVNVPLSADLFGLTTSSDGDLGIGQRLEDALVYFDYVSPMVYPSHFAYNFNNYPKPALEPYGVVKYSMDHAVAKALNASSTPDKLRPWLQAFDLGAVYSPAMIRAQIQAVYDAGLNSYMLWNAGSIYNKEELMPIPEKPEAI
jgi:hypothetical protein